MVEEQPVNPKGEIGRKLRHRHLQREVYSRSPARLVVGAGVHPLKGWTCTDIRDLDIRRASDFAAILKPATITVIFAEHVWEHLTFNEGTTAARNCLQYLLPSGRLRIAVPDGLNPRPDYIDHVRPPKDGHKVLYDHKMLSSVLQEAGYRVELLEYYDENGSLRTGAVDERFGVVKRSVCNDHRNRDGVIRYTSLIVDAFPRR